MMGWYGGSGMSSLGWLGMGLFWLILLGLIIWLVVPATRKWQRDDPRHG